MEVTLDNFSEIYPSISKAIEEADFVAFDGEFSGLGVELATFQHDSMEDRYKKLREGVRGFLMIQVGLCPFKWIAEKQRYEAKPFNVYVFPRPFGRCGENTRFACQCGSLDFLANNGFDFNKFIHKGVSYLLPSDESKLRSAISKKYSKIQEDAKQDNIMAAEAKGNVANSNAASTPVPLKFKQYVKETCDAIEAFISDDKEVSLDLSPSSGFKRRLIYEAVESRFPSGIYLESCPSKKGKFLRVQKGNGEDKKKSQEATRSAEEMELDIAAGFSKVIRNLQTSEKPIIGHNMLLDVMLSINQFFAPLPEGLDDFKTLVQTAYPRLMDTKLLASTSPLKNEISSSVLMDLKERISQSPFVEPPVDFAEKFDLYKDSTSKYHDAGYDSYVTGLSFIAMATHLQKLEKSEKSNDSLTKLNFEAPILKPFLNKINITRLQGIPYLNVQGEDPNPERKNVFSVQCNAAWSTNDIVSLFSPYGFVYISWVNDTMALVALDKPEKGDDVIRNLVAGNCQGDYRVLTYAQYKGLEDIDKYNNVKNLPSKKKKRKRQGLDQTNAIISDPKASKMMPEKPESDPEEGEIKDSDSIDGDRDQEHSPKDNGTGDQNFNVPNEW